jgi:hypothetical protein
MRLFSSFLSTFLIPLVAVMPLRAELAATIVVSTAAASATILAETTPGQTNVLKIRLADDSKATVEANSIVKGYAILVTDSSGSPVADAAVAIRLPDEGPTGFFINGEHSAVAYTDASGVARFPQVNWGSATGGLSIRVTAVKGELHAGALIEQTVIAAGKTPASAPVSPFPSSHAPATTAPADPSPVPAPVAKTKTPGVPASVAAIHSGAAPDQQPAADSSASNDTVSVVNTSGSKGGNGSNKKWFVLAAVLASAGVGAALALAGKSGATGTGPGPSTSTTIGTPTVSIGH